MKNKLSLVKELYNDFHSQIDNIEGLKVKFDNETFEIQKDLREMEIVMGEKEKTNINQQLKNNKFKIYQDNLEIHCQMCVDEQNDIDS